MACPPDLSTIMGLRTFMSLAAGIPWSSILQQFSVDLNQDGLPRLGEDLRH